MFRSVLSNDQRFDVRGYLNDLTQFQSNSKTSGQQLTAEELHIERLCDEERFADLKDDLDDSHGIIDTNFVALKILFLLIGYLEEELKRLHLALADGSGYNQISYNYDENNVIPNSDSAISEVTPKVDESDGFKLPSGLSPPENIVLVGSHTYCYKFSHLFRL